LELLASRSRTGGAAALDTVRIAVPSLLHQKPSNTQTAMLFVTPTGASVKNLICSIAV
jgi:hypothetical protein